MSKKNKNKIKKTLVEKMLDQQKIAYKQLVVPTHEEHGVAQMDIDKIGIDKHQVYKTLVLTGKKTGPIVGVLPLDERLDEKALARVSGNKSVDMLPLKELEKTTGYEHGANTPIGIWQKEKFPIFIDQTAKEQQNIAISSGNIGRSIQINADDLAKLVHAKFVDILQ